MIFDVLLVAVALFLLLVGLVGCVLPVLPGPPISFLALIFLHLSRWGEFNVQFLWLAAFMATAVTVLDYLVPMWGTKRFGGTGKGIWGASVGLVVGFFFAPWGIVVGPFLGAFVGEMISHNDSNRAFRAAFGSFIGIIAGVVLKLVVSGYFSWHFFKELFSRSQI
ncbi:DUF456 domain-containing protein [Natronoflexus pectinivorans]|uniref:DUF456 domain-containing protein n=1 Tax=Natronoflexus pectinivorans TaxID=682526 RepID=A0A4R2GPL2_9BACT|nr:DUF456 domain-containing protein [Natronoflexus pectinivorans]TCO10988.1 hypothetical protein EV194_101622 [Natronoflexus pectinivorans]